MVFLGGGEFSCQVGLSIFFYHCWVQRLLGSHIKLCWSFRALLDRQAFFQVAPHHTPKTHEDMLFCPFGVGETEVQKGKVMCSGYSKRGHDTTKSTEAQVCALGPGMICRNGGHMEPQWQKPHPGARFWAVWFCRQWGACWHFWLFLLHPNSFSNAASKSNSVNTVV